MINTEHTQGIEFNATYSPEDNKLRFTASERLPQELYEQAKALGFRWAPKQELFYAHWRVSAQDFVLQLAETIDAEEMSLAERAEIKAARLTLLAEKRKSEARGFEQLANNLASSMGNQPVLAGHHSQRKAEKAATQQERAKELAERSADAVGYWRYRIEGIQHHVNYKTSTGVIIRRIDTLLKDLRTQQRKLNEASTAMDFWDKMAGREACEKRDALIHNASGFSHLSPWGSYSKLEDGEITVEEFIPQMQEFWAKRKNSRVIKLTILHLLNRIAYEQSQLWEVPVFEGKLTPAIIQTFARTHGAESPKARATDFGWEIESTAKLPMQIAEDNYCIELDDAEVRQLMKDLYYSVPAKKAAPQPILNLEATDIQAIKVKAYGSDRYEPMIELTKEQYKNIYSDYKGVRKSACGTFRIKCCLNPLVKTKNHWDREWVVVSLTDSKIHDMPGNTDSILIKECDDA